MLNNDDSCPNSLQNQQFVKYLFQAQPKGLVTLDFKQNGDYYISCAVSCLLCCDSSSPAARLKT